MLMPISNKNYLSIHSSEGPLISIKPKRGDKCIYIEDYYNFNDYTTDIKTKFEVADLEFYILDRCTSFIRLFQWKRKHWWSLRYSWQTIYPYSKDYKLEMYGSKDGYGSKSTDYNKNLESYLMSLMELHPDAHVENHSNIIRFNRNCYIRKVFTEKYFSRKRADGTIKYSKAKICKSAVYVPNSLTKGNKYLYKEHPDNQYKMEGFEKFILLKDDYGRICCYPEGLFKFKDGKI